MTRFIDTNIFLRHLTGYEPLKAQACFALFKRAQHKEVTLVTSESVIAEVVYLLPSKRVYHLPRAGIRAKLSPLLSIPFLKLPHRKTILYALDVFADSTLDFEDALTVGHVQQRKLTELYSYDGDFDQFKGLKHFEARAVIRQPLRLGGFSNQSLFLFLKLSSPCNSKLAGEHLCQITSQHCK